jgi:hypothetical protein
MNILRAIPLAQVLDRMMKYLSRVKGKQGVEFWRLIRVKSLCAVDRSSSLS